MEWIGHRQYTVLARWTGVIGIVAVVYLVSAFLVFAGLVDDFHWIHDYISELGATGSPQAWTWNVFGFGIGGLLIAVFGGLLGIVVADRLVAGLLVAFGLFFSCSGIPADMAAPENMLTRVHVAAVCLAAACWMLGLARLASRGVKTNPFRQPSNVAAVGLILPIVGGVVGAIAAPIAHRLCLLVILAWVTVISIRLICLSNLPASNLDRTTGTDSRPRDSYAAK